MFDFNFPDWDQELFLYLNSKNVAWLDPIMVTLSKYSSWFAVCLLIIFIMLYKDRIRGKIATLFLIIGLAMNTFLNTIIKWLIMRPRPGNEDLLKDLINLLEDTGNTYSFFSAHSSNSLCLAVFSSLYFRNKIYSIVIVIWAVAVAYSRIYVGKHYPLDVIVGILFGLLTGWMSYWLYRKYGMKKTLPEEEKILESD